MPEWDWLEKASDEELRKLAADRFHQYRTNFHESAVEFLYEGHFIVQLLESRRTGKIEARSRKLEHTSLFLEVVIVALVVVEIGLAVVSLRRMVKSHGGAWTNDGTNERAVGNVRRSAHASNQRQI